MHAERLFLETNEKGQLQGLPDLRPHQKIEVILLLPDETVTPAIRRQPSPFLAGKMKILSDIIEPPLSLEEWDLQLKQWDNNL